MDQKIKVGSNVYVKNPQRFIADCESITGDVAQIIDEPAGTYCTVNAYVAKIGSGYSVSIDFEIDDLDIRYGTLISKISTQPNNPGYNEWLRISESWQEL